MATRNQTALFKRYRESLQNARRPFVATGGPGGGGSIELVEAPLLNQGGPRGYNAIVADDAGANSSRKQIMWHEWAGHVVVGQEGW
jgi:hypothetical protein